MSHSAAQTGTRPPFPVRATRALEDNAGLDRAAGLLESASRRLTAPPRRRDLLHGTWLGHAIHPLLTDLPLGAFLSTTLLDVLGGSQSRTAATRLLTFGVLKAVPTAVTGVSEVAGTERRVQRVALVHAAANIVTLAAHSQRRWSLVARRRAGVLLGLAGGAVSVVGGHLGGHLTEVRKVSSRHPASCHVAQAAGDASAA